MSTIREEPGECIASASTRHKTDWAKVDDVGKANAYNQLFATFSKMEDSAFVSFPGSPDYIKRIKDHGKSYVFVKFKEWTVTEQRDHTDLNKITTGARHWEGTRRFTYVALVEVTTV